MVVKNEDRFVWYAIMSVLPFVKKFIIYDTGSTDQTVEIIKTMGEHMGLPLRKKIIFKQFKIKSAKDISQLRLQQVKETETDWFLIVDGDEIWPEEQLIKLLTIGTSPSRWQTQRDRSLSGKLAFVNKTRNCVGDIWHYLPESAGKYNLLGRTGHLTIRLMKKMDYQMLGTYPDEGYAYQGKLINQQDEWLSFVDAWYLHTTHLPHSTLETESDRSKLTFARGKFLVEKGIEMKKEELPGILFQGKNKDILNKRSTMYELFASLITPLKYIKRKIS